MHTLRLSFKFTLFIAMLCTWLNIQQLEAISIVLDILSYGFLLMNANHLLLHYFPFYSTPVGLHGLWFDKLTWAFIFLPSHISMPNFFMCLCLEQQEWKWSLTEAREKVKIKEQSYKRGRLKQGTHCRKGWEWEERTLGKDSIRVGEDRPGGEISIQGSVANSPSIRMSAWMWWASQVAWWWRICLPAPEMQETEKTWVWSPGQGDPLEKKAATHPSILAWEIPRAEKPGGLQSVDWLSQIGPSDYAFTPVQWCVLGKAGGAAAESRGGHSQRSVQGMGERDWARLVSHRPLRTNTIMRPSTYKTVFGHGW